MSHNGTAKGLIKSVEQVVKLANSGGSCWSLQWGRTTPAAFLASMQARVLHDLVARKLLYVYIAPKKKGKKALDPAKNWARRADA